MTGLLLWRGMLAGLAGAFVAATFALIVAEPYVDAAIAFEARHAAHAGGVELVSRATQKTLGLYIALMLYGTALGGLLAIVVAACHGRVGAIPPRALAVLLAALACVVLVLAPALKYPPTPPAVGLHETVRLRTGAFLAMLAGSLLAALAGAWAAQRLGAVLTRLDRWLAGGLVYLAAVALVAALLPHVDEVPADFPASLLWQYRVAAIAGQMIFWLVTAELFGRLAQPLLAPRVSR
ncbi:CbtA family protein [Sphingomonas citri]